jgi:hypothetical protein
MKLTRRPVGCCGILLCIVVSALSGKCSRILRLTSLIGSGKLVRPFGPQMTSCFALNGTTASARRLQPLTHRTIALPCT